MYFTVLRCKIVWIQPLEQCDTKLEKVKKNLSRSRFELNQNFSCTHFHGVRDPVSLVSSRDDESVKASG